MKKMLFIVAFALFFVTANVSSQEIKIGTVAPTGSAWETIIKEIAAEWTRISNGEISVKIYTGGTVGDEADIVRKIKLGRLNAAALTPQGMRSISSDLFSLVTPFMFEDEEEFDYVFTKMQPTLGKKLEQNGFVPLGWAMTGWIRWFTTEKVLYPSDIVKLKLAVDNSDERAIELWKKIGFSVIPLSLPDLMSGIYSGMAEGTYILPYAASAMGISEYVPYLLDFPISPIYGALAISDRTWRSIDDKYKPQIIKQTNTILGNFYERISEIENEGIEIMKQNGLVVTPITADAEREWFNLIKGELDAYMKDTISPEVSAEIRKYISEYRKN